MHTFRVSSSFCRRVEFSDHQNYCASFFSRGPSNRRILVKPTTVSVVAEIGLGLIGFGIFFSFLGVLLFFDRGLLALGNILWLSGVAILLGWRSTWDVFTNRANYKGTVSFLLGLFFIFVRWPIVGIILELYGCIRLFGGFWPSIKMILYQIPVLGWIIQYPILLLGRLSRGSA